MSAARKAAGVAAVVTLGLCAFIFIVAALAFAIYKLGGPVLYGGFAALLLLFLTCWLCAYRDLTTRDDQ